MSRTGLIANERLPPEHCKQARAGGSASHKELDVGRGLAESYAAQDRAVQHRDLTQRLRSGSAYGPGTSHLLQSACN